MAKLRPEEVTSALRQELERYRSKVQLDSIGGRRDEPVFLGRHGERCANGVEHAGLEGGRAGVDADQVAHCAAGRSVHAEPVGDLDGVGSVLDHGQQRLEEGLGVA